MLFFSVSCQPKYSKYKLKKFGLAQNSWWNILGLHSTTFPEDRLWGAGNVKRSWLKCKSGGSPSARRLSSEPTLSDPSAPSWAPGLRLGRGHVCALIIYIWATANFPYYKSLLCMCMLSPSVVSDSLQPVDCSPPGHALLQGIFQTQGSNPHFLCLLHWQVDSLPLSYLGNLQLCLLKPTLQHICRG